MTEQRRSLEHTRRHDTSPSLKWVFDQLQVAYGTATMQTPPAPFALLVHTILSQHTNDKNSSNAFADLQKEYPITPQVLSSISVARLGAAIRRAGLWRIKAERIREAAEAVLNHFNGDLANVLQQPLPQARLTLLSIPGVGYKTADILLLFYSHQPVIPLDTHCLRVSQRLGYGDGKNYESIRERLEEGLPRDYRTYYIFHTGLIMHGRRTCHAQHPSCHRCILASQCPSRVLEHTGSPSSNSGDLN